MLVNITWDLRRLCCAYLCHKASAFRALRSFQGEKWRGKKKKGIFENPSILSVYKAGPSFAQRCGGNTIPGGFQCQPGSEQPDLTVDVSVH